MQELAASLMDGGFFVVHGTDDREAVHPGRQSWQVLAYPNARESRGDRAKRPTYGGRGIRLWVPGFELAGTAYQKQQDHRPLRSYVEGIFRRERALRA